MNDYVAFILGLLCAGMGGELFVRGAVRLALWMRISSGIVGATVAAFATSSPELAVSIRSAIAGTPQIALGDALGSNVVNIALILALALLISGIQAPRDSVRRDFPVALLVPVVTGFLFLDGTLSRIDGLFLLGLFVTWLVALIFAGRKQRSTTEVVLGTHSEWTTGLFCLVGLSLLVTAGHLIVTGATGIATAFGIDPFVVGATIVAVGTSAPELATTLIAKLRGHDEVGLGTILGSNIFNGLLIVAVAAIISPITVEWREVAAALVCGLVAVMCTYPPRDGLITRRRGMVLLALYAGYILSVLSQKG